MASHRSLRRAGVPTGVHPHRRVVRAGVFWPRHPSVWFPQRRGDQHVPGAGQTGRNGGAAHRRAERLAGRQLGAHPVLPRFDSRKPARRAQADVWVDCRGGAPVSAVRRVPGRQRRGHAAGHGAEHPPAGGGHVPGHFPAGAGHDAVRVAEFDAGGHVVPDADGGRHVRPRADGVGGVCLPDVRAGGVYPPEKHRAPAARAGKPRAPAPPAPRRMISA